MKNVQVVDSALNCSFSIFAIPDDLFSLLFPLSGQDIEFIEDVEGRLGAMRFASLCELLWNSRVEKSSVVGIHGTLYFGMVERKSFFPNKREVDGRSHPG